jgi:hypothetical protein
MRFYWHLILAILSAKANPTRKETAVIRKFALNISLGVGSHQGNASQRRFKAIESSPNGDDGKMARKWNTRKHL